MNVEEMLEWSIDRGDTDLQALIMFLVYEKKTLSLSDHSDKINFYTQEKFNKKMNDHLAAYKKQMNITYKSIVYSIITQQGTIYAVAHTENDVKYLMNRYKSKIERIEPMADDYKMVELDEQGNETYFTIKQLREQAKKIPSIIGGF